MLSSSIYGSQKATSLKKMHFCKLQHFCEVSFKKRTWCKGNSCWFFNQCLWLPFQICFNFCSISSRKKVTAFSILVFFCFRVNFFCAHSSVVIFSQLTLLYRRPGGPLFPWAPGRYCSSSKPLWHFWHHAIVHIGWGSSCHLRSAV